MIPMGIIDCSGVHLFLACTSVAKLHASFFELSLVKYKCC